MYDKILLTIKHCTKIKDYYYLKKCISQSKLTFKNFSLVIIAFDGQRKRDKGRKG